MSVRVIHSDNATAMRELAAGACALEVSGIIIEAVDRIETGR